VLAAALKDRGWNQVQAAKQLGVSQALVSAYLRGEREPLLSTAARIAGVLGLSLDPLAGLNRRGSSL
jgi:transcriptional regulator with XRE-family HTH domain